MNHDFSKGSVKKAILSLALPMTLAQLINVLYNIVDRIYIGRIPENAVQSLTGLGVAFPLITIVIAFANLIGMGGAPLFSIERGRDNYEEAEYLMGNAFVLLISIGLALTAIGLFVKRPLLMLLGASTETLPYADAYITIYLFGSIFVMLSLGMNNFINAQGFGTMGMLTVIIGAVINVILDPIFIFIFGMGVRGAALATIISQFCSALWTLRFLTGSKTIIRIETSRMRLQWKRVMNIMWVGMSGFVMAITNSIVQMAYNASLQTYGSDIYVGVMTVINSVREVIHMPVMGLTSGAQPVISFNYGASETSRVKASIRFMTVVVFSYTFLAWGLTYLFPRFFIHIFNEELAEAGVLPLRIYFFGFYMMALQFAGQTVFTSLGKAKHAIFFSVFRKIIIVLPLILVLPAIPSLGVNGIFMAEPVSNFIGGTACFATMWFMIYRKLGDKHA